jgi:hypothetical protein
MTDVYADMAEADVWYVGDKRALAEYYGRAVQRDRPSLQNRLWAQGRALDEPERRIHVPVAGDIASASADLLFSEAPIIRVDDEPTQKRLDWLLEEAAVHMRFLESAELTAALGDGYLTAVWDRDAVPDRPILTSWAGDMAIPTIRHGRLLEVTFWREVTRDGAKVLRYLERHAVEASVGFIEYALFEGTPENLGRRIDLGAHDDTAHLVALTDSSDRQATGIPYLTATHVPNVRPNRKHRGHLGRSDYAAPVYDEMDALDQTVTSWMREFRLGQGRAVVPSGALEDLGEGKGSYFDVAREIYDELSMPPKTGEGLTVIQFAIRVEEHRGTADHWLASIARSCGYSPSTFGVADEAGERTATEVVDRKSRSISSSSRKGMYWKPSIRRILQAMLALDARHFNGTGDPTKPITVELAPPEQPSMESVARTVQMLDAAGAISDYMKVKMRHPTWREPDILEEVDRIQRERTTEADPFAEVGHSLAGNRLDDGQGDGAPPAEDPPADE